MQLEEGYSEGYALLCDEKGTILEIVHDSIGISSLIPTGSSWSVHLDGESLVKGKNFFQEVLNRGAVFDWELNLHLGSRIVSFHFAGLRYRDNLLIVAADTSGSMTQMIEEVTKVGNEQVNLLRTLLKENTELKSRIERNSALFDELSRLNNELVNMKRQLTKNNLELENLNSLKNRILGVAAHDLRNPLANLRILSEALLEEDLEPDLQREYLQHIYDTSGFLINLVSELLDVSVIESGKIDLDREKTDLVELIEKNVRLNRFVADRKEISLDFHTELERAETSVDRDKIQLVLNNLISNAVKYSKAATKVTVSLLEEEGRYLVSVRDEGQGIKQEEMNRLFKAFQRTSAEPTAGEKSTGLGLFIAKGIVENHNGSLSAESEYGKGSVFTVALPKI